MLNQLPIKNQVDKKLALSEPQREAIDHGDGPLLISAGAGSGKTRTLTQRVIKLVERGVKPNKIVAITFTNKAADEMKNRIVRGIVSLRSSDSSASNISDTSNNSDSASALQMPFIGTFHSFCARILRKEARKVSRDPSYVIFDSNDSKKLVRKILKSIDNKESQTPAKTSWEISKIKSKLLDPSELDEPIRTIFEAYESELKRQNAFDFDDLIEKVVRLLQNNPETLEKYRRLYSHMLVDEYQDINQGQYELIKLLCGDHKNITVVGDDQQSIYGFRWSDFTNFLNFEKDWPDAKIIELGENYRSTANIVNAAANLIKKNKLQRHKDLWTTNEAGEPIKVVGTNEADEEANIIASAIMGRGKRSDAAILYRTNAQSRAIEQALNFNSIPYDVFGGIRFYERQEVKDIVAALRYASNPKDELSKERIEKTFRKKIREELIGNLPAKAKELDTLELLGYILKTADYFGYLASQFKNSEERAENVAELVRFASSFDSLSELIERVSLLQATDKMKEGGGKAVRLMTMHLAKGLEFDEVYIAGASEGLLPHQRSLLSQKELEEERRLAYVAMTRAKKHLHISFYGFASRFLHELPPELIEFTTADRMNEGTVYLD